MALGTRGDAEGPLDKANPPGGLALSRACGGERFWCSWPARCAASRATVPPEAVFAEALAAMRSVLLFFLRGLRIQLLCTGLEYADAWARWCCRSRRTRAVRGFGLDSQPHIATQSFRPIFSSIFSSGQMRRHNEHDLEAVLRLHSTEDGRIA